MRDKFFFFFFSFSFSRVGGDRAEANERRRNVSGVKVGRCSLFFSFSLFRKFGSKLLAKLISFFVVPVVFPLLFVFLVLVFLVPFFGRESETTEQKKEEKKSAQTCLELLEFIIFVENLKFLWNDLRRCHGCRCRRRRRCRRHSLFFFSSRPIFLLFTWEPQRSVETLRRSSSQ